MLFLIPLLGFLSGAFTKSMGVLMKRILHSLNHSKRLDLNRRDCLEMRFSEREGIKTDFILGCSRWTLI